MEPGVQCHIHKGPRISPILSRIIQIYRIDTYFFKVHSNVVLPSSPGLPNGLFPVGLPIKMFKVLLAKQNILIENLVFRITIWYVLCC